MKMNEESTIFGVSVRGLLVFIMTVTVCFLCSYMVIALGIKDKIPEPLYTGFSLGLGFYFGQKSASNGSTKGDNNEQAKQ